MRWKLQEFLYEMKNDPERRVLFVEGDRDVAFWRGLAANRNRHSMIYPVHALEITGQVDGERGRLLRAAESLLESDVSDRVLFFSDADADRILTRTINSNVRLTDGRDLESYAISANCLRHLCDTCFPQTAEHPDGLLEQINRIGRPLGILRVVSARSDLRLPFQRTLGDRLSRFLNVSNGNLILDFDHLLLTLLQNAGIARRIDEIRALCAAESVALEGVQDSQLVHGGDLIDLLAIKFHVGSEEMRRHLHMCIQMEKALVAAFPNIVATNGWLA